MKYLRKFITKDGIHSQIEEGPLNPEGISLHRATVSRIAEVVTSVDKDGMDTVHSRQYVCEQREPAMLLIYKEI